MILFLGNFAFQGLNTEILPLSPSLIRKSQLPDMVAHTQSAIAAPERQKQIDL